MDDHTFNPQKAQALRPAATSSEKEDIFYNSREMVTVTDAYRDTTVKVLKITDLSLKDKLRRSIHLKRSRIPTKGSAFALLLAITGPVGGALTIDPEKSYVFDGLVGAHIQATFYLLALAGLFFFGWMIYKIFMAHHQPALAEDSVDGLMKEIVSGCEIDRYFDSKREETSN